MSHQLKPPKPPSKAELATIARLAIVVAANPNDARAKARLDALLAKGARRAQRAKRVADQIEARAAAQAKREARAAEKAEAEALRKARREARAAEKAELESARKAKRDERAARAAAKVARGFARAQRKAIRERKLILAAQKQEKAYQWALRKAEIADYKANRVPYLREVKRLLAEEPWTLVERQQDIVEIAARRVIRLRLDTRAALAVSGPDDPETILEYQRLVKETKSALNSRQYETRRLKRYEAVAREFDRARARA